MTPAARPSEVIGAARTAVARDRARVTLVASITSSVLSLVAIGLVLLLALPAVTRQSDDIARQVSAQVVADARAQRIVTGQMALDTANAALAARRLLPVSGPGPEVPFERRGDALAIAAAQANTVVYLDDVGALRRGMVVPGSGSLPGGSSAGGGAAPRAATPTGSPPTSSPLSTVPGASPTVGSAVGPRPGAATPGAVGASGVLPSGGGAVDPAQPEVPVLVPLVSQLPRPLGGGAPLVPLR